MRRSALHGLPVRCLVCEPGAQTRRQTTGEPGRPDARLLTMESIFHMIDGAPDPVAPFSHAVEADGWVFITGQMPFTGIANDSAYPEGIEAQTHQVMANLKRVLAGCNLAL